VKPDPVKETPRQSGDTGLPGSESGGAADGALRAAILDRDRKAIAELVSLHADAIYRFIYHRLDRPEAVDDLVQDVFLAALTAIAAFRVESSLRTWILSIARHKIADYYRARLRSIVFEDADALSDEPAADLRIDELVDRRRLEEHTRAVLSTLSDSYRTVLVCRYWDQRSVAEIAEMSGKSEKAIERLLARAREQFKRRWKHG
jgi:RNA polymerase sigma-70 factor (ECF subfamily)